MVLELFAPFWWHFNLFIATFLSATIIPLPSEPAIIYTLTKLDPMGVFIVAMAGSTLGSITNYYIGSAGIRHFLVGRHEKREKQAKELIDEYGFTMLLIFPWIPFIGDPILIVAGILKMDFQKFVTWIVVARAIKVMSLIVVGPQILHFLGIA